MCVPTVRGVEQNDMTENNAGILSKIFRRNHFAARTTFIPPTGEQFILSLYYTGAPLCTLIALIYSGSKGSRDENLSTFSSFKRWKKVT